MHAFIEMLKKYWYIVILSVAIVSLASFIISVIQPAEYRSSVRLLVIQKQEGGIDAYSAARSAETIAGTLTEVIYTSTFFDQVMAAGFNVNIGTFSTDPEKRKEEWKRAVDARVVQDSGTLQIDIYDENRNQSEQLAFSVAFVLINQGEQYHGGGKDIEIKMIDAPVTSDTPARPNTVTNTIAGFVLGLLASLSIIFLLSERKSRESSDDMIEVKTMPMIENADAKIEIDSAPIEPTMQVPTDVDEVEKSDSGSMVKNRIMQELDRAKEPPVDFPNNNEEEPTEQLEVEQQVEAPRVTNDMRKKEVGSRLAQGMDNISLDEGVADQSGTQEIVYESEDIEDDYKKQNKLPRKDDKYSPDKVDRWIKTGKFE